MFVKGLMRIIVIMLQQVRQSRLESIMEQFRDPHSKALGVYVPIDHSCEQTLTEAHIDPKIIAQVQKDSLTLDKVLLTKDMQTHARQLTSDQFYTLFRHGFEVADFTLLAHDPKQFRHTAFANSRWQGIVT